METASPEKPQRSWWSPSRVAFLTVFLLVQIILLSWACIVPARGYNVLTGEGAQNFHEVSATIQPPEAAPPSGPRWSWHGLRPGLGISIPLGLLFGATAAGVIRLGRWVKTGR